MSEDHAAAIEQAFSHQAQAFEDRRFNRIFTTDVAWLLEDLDPAPDDLVLDVAAGTGHVARALAPAVRAVVALDATVAMLAEGRAAAAAAGLRNVVFQRGDAAALPFLDGSFDLVVTRFAIHHFAGPAGPVGEMARCVRPGGRVLVADLIADDDPEVAARQNELERLRDPSHTTMPSAAELVALVRGAGLADVRLQAREIVRPLAPWLAQTGVSEEVGARVTAALRADAAGGPPTGFSPRERDGAWEFVHTVACVTGVRPLGPPATDPAASGTARRR
jgi:ubiquinone/menaquinone biosynthesis C-methylase UbiE